MLAHGESWTSAVGQASRVLALSPGRLQQRGRVSPVTCSSTASSSSVLRAADSSGVWSKDVNQNSWELALRNFDAALAEALSVWSDGQPVKRQKLPKGRTSSWIEALLLLEEARLKDVPVSVEVFEAAAAKCRFAGLLTRTVDVLQEAERRNVDPSTTLYEVVICACNAANRWQDALEHLVDAYEYGVGPSSRMLKRFLWSCITSEEWELAWQQALELLVGVLPQWDIVPESYHYGLVMKSLRCEEKWKITLDLMHEMRRTKIQPGIRCYDGAAFAFQGRWQAALGLLADARSRGVRATLHRTIANCAQEAREEAVVSSPFWDEGHARRSLQSKWRRAFDLFFREMDLQGLERTRPAYRFAIKACPPQYWQLSLHLLERMQSESVAPDAATYREAMRVCAYTRQGWHAAIHIFDEMAAGKISRGVEEHNQLIRALIAGHRWGEALQHFDAMRRRAHAPAPNVQTYNLIYFACSDSVQEGVWSNAVKIWLDMQKAQITPDWNSYNNLLLVAERGQHWGWSRQLLDTLFQLGAPMTVTMFNAALNAASRSKRWDLAIDLLREMKEEQVSPTMLSYSMAVKACEEADRFDMARQVLEESDVQDLQ